MPFLKKLRGFFFETKRKGTLRKAAKLARMSPAQLRAHTRKRSKRYDKYR